MKKLIALMLVVAMAATMIVGCSKKDDQKETTAPETTAPETTAAPETTTAPETTAPEGADVEIAESGALKMMNAIWDSYMKNAGEDMLFPMAGGDTQNSVMDAPGIVNVKNAEYMSNIMNVPAELHAQIDEAANLMHMMNANTFTAGAYHVTAGSDMDAFVKTLTEGIKGTQWMCGFPEKLMIATVNGEYVVAVYGAGELIDIFKIQMTTVYADAKIVVEEALG